MASTTQLMGLDGNWSPRAFELAGWEVPDFSPSLPGHIGGYVTDSVRLASVGSHDTASAVAGLSPITDSTIFLNVGTWSLIGCVVDHPIVSDAARTANLTNERTVDGRVRLLKNVPGFYVINRLHEELGVGGDVPHWLATADMSVAARIDLDDEGLFNPKNLVEYVIPQLAQIPKDHREWAGIALQSLIDALAKVPAQLAEVTGRTFSEIRVGGGGSRSEVFCQTLAQASGLAVSKGAAECTVQGNLAVQFAAQAAIGF
jgi:rhamnulokinase